MKEFSRYFLILLTALQLIGCAKDEETKEVPKTGIELVAIGPILFGGVLVGDYRDAAIRVYNYGPENLSTSNLPSKVTAPFFVQSIAEPCASGTLRAGKNCVISIRFRPTQGGDFSNTITIGNATLQTSGKGMLGGVISISENTWDLGPTIAGQEFRKDFFVTNEGDFTVPSPVMQLPPGISTGFYTCGAYLQAHKTCRVELISTKTLAEQAIETIYFNSGSAGVLQVSLISNVSPADASGAIEFDNAPVTIIADGTSQYTVTTKQIKDQYGNVIKDNSPVRFSVANTTLITPTPQLSVDGRVTFTFQSTTQKGFSTVSLIAAEASGFLRARATAGPPSGIITVQSYQSTIIANGQTQIQFKVNPMQDQFGNIVEDGNPVYFNLVGGGSLSAPVVTTVLGQAQVVLTSSSQTGTATIQVRAGPILDVNNQIVGYRASGDFPVTYVPGPPAGNIAIALQHPAVYAIQDSFYESQGIPIRSTVVFGPVKDIKGNVVDLGTTMNISVTGGTNITYTGANPVTATTDINGFIQIQVGGNGSRGAINIEMTGGNGAVGTSSVWAFLDTTLKYSSSPDNKVSLSEKYFSATALPGKDIPWMESEGFGGIEFADNINQNGPSDILISRINNPGRTFSSSLPLLLWPSFFTKGLQVYVGPTQKDDGPFKVQFDPVRLGSDPIGAAKESNFNWNQLNLSSVPIVKGYNSAHDPNMRYPGMGYIPSLDRFLIFGGYKYDLIANTSDYLGNTSKLSTFYTGLTRTDVPATVSNQIGTENFDDIGSYPPSMGLTNFVNYDNKLFTMGGFNAELEGGEGYNQVYMYNGSTSKWTNLFPDNDPNEPDTSGEPAARQQNGLVFVPDTKTLYMIGGLRRFFCNEFLTQQACQGTVDPTTGSNEVGNQCTWSALSCIPQSGKTGMGWVQGPQRGGSDIWKLDLSPMLDNAQDQTITWKRICGSQRPQTPSGGVNSAYTQCNLPFVHINPDPVSPQAPKKPVKTLAVWNDIRKKIYVYYEGISGNVFSIDPYTDTVSPALDNATSLAPLDQVFFNKKSGKTFAYQKGPLDPNGSPQTNSVLKVWDTNPGEKIYYKVKIDVGAGTKQFGQLIRPKIRAYGSTTVSTVSPSNGVSAYIFNYTINNWELIGSNSAIDNSNLNAQVISKDYLTSDISNYVSTTGIIEILITPNGSPDFAGTSQIGIDQILLEGRF